jgi:hypothetical protein
MSDEQPRFQVLFSDEFKERVRTLAKRYRQIQPDLQPLINDLQSGNLVGDQIPGTGYTVSKSGSRIVIFRKVNVQAIVLFISLKILLASYW